MLPSGAIPTFSNPRRITTKRKDPTLIFSSDVDPDIITSQVAEQNNLEN
jgi:hypothetical protein